MISLRALLKNIRNYPPFIKELQKCQIKILEVEEHYIEDDNFPILKLNPYPAYLDS